MMKKVLSLVLAAFLALQAGTAVMAETEMESADGFTGSATMVKEGIHRNAKILQGTMMMTIGTDTGYGLADLDGQLITEAIYASSFDVQYGYIGAALAQSATINCNGVLDQKGQVVVPFEYGKVSILSKYFAIGYTLKDADANQFDFESNRGDKYYLIDTVTVYYLPDAGKTTLTLERSHFIEAETGNYASYRSDLCGINIKDRTSGVITTYDAALSAVGNVEKLSDYSLMKAALIIKRDNGRQGLFDAQDNQLVPYDYSRIDENVYEGVAMVNANSRYGLYDTVSGKELLPCDYLSIVRNTLAAADPAHAVRYYSSYNAYIAGGYVKTTKDDVYVYVNLATGEEFNTGYVRNDIDYPYYGATMMIDEKNGKTLVAADGVETTIECKYLFALDNASGFYYRCPDDYTIRDWHGNIVHQLRSTYSSVALTMDGRYFLDDAEDGNSKVLYELSYPANMNKEEKDPEQPGEEAAATETTAADKEGGNSFFEGLFGPSKDPKPEAETVSPAEVETQPAEGTPAEPETVSPAEAEPQEGTPAETVQKVEIANAGAVVTLLKQAQDLLKADAANAISAKALLTSAALLIGEDGQAAAGYVNAAALLLDNGEAMVAPALTLLSTVLQMLQ